MIYTVCKYFFWFMLYSVAGWIMETLLYILRDRRVVKRGFLFGPLCPIYGTGAVLCTLLLYGRVRNIALIFIIGMLLCGTLEYLAHFLMEKVFHAMWWDYSDRRFNIRGRVYLKGLLLFGAAVVLIIRVTQPLVVQWTVRIPPAALYWICFVLYTVLLMDLATTIADLKGSIHTLKTIQSTALANTQKGIDQTGEQIEQLRENIRKSDLYLKTMHAFTQENTVLRRLQKNYPGFRMKKYRFILDVLRDAPQEGKRASGLKLYGTADSLPDPDEDDMQRKNGTEN